MFYVIIGLLIIGSVVLSKLFRINSFLIALMFIFAFSFLNGMLFTFAIKTGITPLLDEYIPYPEMPIYR